MPAPFQYSATGVDLSPRYFYTETVAASPAAAAETTVASLTIGADLAYVKGIRLSGYLAFTAGTNGVTATVKIRRTNTSGTTIVTSGAVTVVAASVYDRFILGVDESPTLPGQVYVLTLTVGSGSAESTVSAAALDAFVL